MTATPKTQSGKEPPVEADEDTDKSIRFELRLSTPLQAALDDWRRHQPDVPNRAKAARRLIEIGLLAEKKARGGED